MPSDSRSRLGYPPQHSPDIHVDDPYNRQQAQSQAQAQQGQHYTGYPLHSGYVDSTRDHRRLPPGAASSLSPAPLVTSRSSSERGDAMSNHGYTRSEETEYTSRRPESSEAHLVSNSMAAPLQYTAAGDNLRSYDYARATSSHNEIPLDNTLYRDQNGLYNKEYIVSDADNDYNAAQLYQTGYNDGSHTGSASLTHKESVSRQAANASRNKHKGKTTVSSIFKGYATTHQLLFLFIVLLQTIASMVLIAFIWAKIKKGTPDALNSEEIFNTTVPDGGGWDQEVLRRRGITVYLVVFLFGSVFEIITALDALRLNNTIQLIGVCLFTAAMMVYAALLDGQIKNALDPDYGYPSDLYDNVKYYILVMPIVQGVAALVLGYITWLLFKDFGWEVLHLIGADRKLKRMYTRYQIYLCLLKFDFFFFVGFSLQYVILVLQVREAEFILTIVAFPVTVLFLLLATIAVRREIRWLTALVVLVETCGLAYFTFKLIRLFQNSQKALYQTTRNTLAVFSSLAIVMLVSTALATIICWRNFGLGLKEAIPGYWGEHKNKRRQVLARKGSSSANATSGNAGKGVYGDNAFNGRQTLDNRQSRMSID